MDSVFFFARNRSHEEGEGEEYGEEGEREENQAQLPPSLRQSVRRTWKGCQFCKRRDEGRTSSRPAREGGAKKVTPIVR